MSADTTHYELLGVDPDAPKDDIRAAYQAKLADVRTHRTREEESRKPSDDTIRAARDEEARLRTAWQVLSDPVQRGRYDEQVHPDGAGGADADADTGEYDVVGEDEDEGATAPPLARPRRESAASIVTAQGLEIPTLGRRVTAAAIDVITMIALWSVITLPVTLGVATKGTPLVVTQIAAIEFLVLVYLIFPTWWFGQTLGKRYTYTMVVDRATGQLPTLGQATIRYILPALAVALLSSTGAIIALFYAMSFLMQRDQISLADRFAKTAVVIARYKPVRSA